jgi:trigger factor
MSEAEEKKTEEEAEDQQEAAEETAPETAEAAEPAEEAPTEEEEAGPDVTVERTGSCECVIRIEADADFLRSRYQEELESLQREVKLPGFRQGKAPMGLVERRMGKSLRNDVISAVVSSAYDDALHEHDLTVVAEVDAPDLENVTWEPGQPAAFEFRCEVLPEVELTEDDYKGLDVKVPALEVTDEMLQHELDRFAQQFSTWNEVAGEDIDWDDYVEAEVSVPKADWSETIGFYPRAERIGPFAVEGLKGLVSSARAGSELDVGAEVDGEQIGGREALEALAGQKVDLHLTIGQVMRRHVPALDDELAKKIGMESADEIQPVVRERLEASLKQEKEQITRDLLVDALVSKKDVELPDSLVERATRDEQTRALVRMLRMGVPRQEAERRAVEGVDRARSGVGRRLKGTFLLRKVAENERIIVTESEVDSQIRGFAARQGWREERARSYMEERGMLRTLRDDMREARVIDFLLESAKVTEVSPEEFRATRGGAAEPEAEEPGGDEDAQ